MQTFSLSIFAPERRLTQDESVKSLILTTAKGEVEILPGHADMISRLETGRFAYVADGKQAVTLELPHEIDRSRARAAQAKAEKMLSDASLDEHSFKKYQLKLQRAIIRQSIGG